MTLDVDTATMIIMFSVFLCLHHAAAENDTIDYAFASYEEMETNISDTINYTFASYVEMEPKNWSVLSELSDYKVVWKEIHEQSDYKAVLIEIAEQSEYNISTGLAVHAGQPCNESRNKRPGIKKVLSISQETKLFLTGSLMTIVIPSIYVVVFIISVPLNIVAIFMFLFRIRPKKPAAIYMLNLATADLLFMLLLPFKVSYHFNGNNWVYGPAMCRVVTFAFYCNMYCSVLLMMSISVDRFLGVVYPIRSMAWRCQRNAVAVCCVMWLLAFAGVMPILLSEQKVYLPELGITTCHEVQQHSYYRYYFPIFTCIFFFIPLIITTTCYVSIIWTLRRTSGSKRSHKTRAVVLAVTVLTVFVACFTPSNILLLTQEFAHQHSDTAYAAYLVSMSLGSVNCCLDPVIYYFGSSQFRKQAARLSRRRDHPESTQSKNSETSKPDTFQGSLDRSCTELSA